MRKLIALLLTFACLASLAACGKEPATYAETDLSKYVTLGAYKELPYTPANTAPTEYEFTVKLQKQLYDSGYGKISTDQITAGKVQIGDKLNIDYSGTKDGVAFEGGTAAGQSLSIGCGRFIAGFEEKLVGVEIGSTVKLDLTFPENYGSAELAGADVVFTVTVNYVEERTTYPELTDELAQTLDKEVKNAAEYLQKIRDALEAEKKETADADRKSALWDQVIENAEFSEKLPAKLLESAQAEFKAYYNAYVQQQGYDSIQDYLSQIGATQAQFDQAAGSYANAAVQDRLAAYAILKAEDYTLTDEDINAMAVSNGYSDKDNFVQTLGQERAEAEAAVYYAKSLVLEKAVAKEA